MLFRRRPCQRLEPVGIMGCSLFNRPLFHLMCNNIGNRSL
ncbi:hypothetical protein EVA_11412 [gut metagenome]|uniref:Uncharacterized protein n=1 Tax=gut metagenome TaxID=749906 RepID=J9FZQ5_9ZZZZ